ncbi:MAG: hypothetical protein IJ097_03810 [Bacilli bacterium]|nr:hypothetical protein [Bacilli bacterium]
MDFKIGEEINEDNDVKVKHDNSKLKLILIIIGAVIIGLIIFLLINKTLNNKEKSTTPEVPTSQKRSLNESNVKILYDYVTYGTSGIRNDKFVKEKKVTINSFNNQEKFYYALQFAQASDFTKITEEENKEKNSIQYYISDKKVKKFMEKFFGKNVKYSKDEKIKYKFDFTLDDIPVKESVLVYSSKLDGYITSFDKDNESTDNSKNVDNEVLLDPYIGKLVEAWKESDGSYRLVEKVIYPVYSKQNDGTYEVNIYSDFDHKNIIEKVTDKDENYIRKIKIDKYIDKGATITYIFKLNGNVLYFDSSKIS